jgi:lysyl endopeptidase
LRPGKSRFPPAFIGSDSYDGLTTCVSINTAVAARVGEHRVTWEPNLSGVPDPAGLQLRIDGALSALGPQGVALGDAGRVAPQAGGALANGFPRWQDPAGDSDVVGKRRASGT